MLVIPPFPFKKSEKEFMNLIPGSLGATIAFGTVTSLSLKNE
jgi:hypothetical protein